MSDVLSGARPASRRRRLLLALLLAVALLAGGAERLVVERQREALQHEVTTGEQVVADSAASQRGVAEYARALLTRADVPASARGAALEALAQDAARWEPRSQARAGAVDRVGVLPWRTGLRAARDAYALRLQQWTAALAQVQREPSEAALAGGEVSASRDRAEAALREAGISLRR